MGGHAAHLLHFCGCMYCAFVNERDVNIETLPIVLAFPEGGKSGRSLGRIETGHPDFRCAACN